MRPTTWIWPTTWAEPESSPWKNIAFALSNVQGVYGDPAVIHIAPGTYSEVTGESLTIVMKSYVKLVGTDRERTFLKSESGYMNSLIYCEDVVGVSITGLTLTGGFGVIDTSGC